MTLTRISCLILSACACAATASAGAFSFSGAFTQDDQFQVFLFTAATPDALVQTWSYAGGTNANGTVIPSGGFDPILTVFDATGGLSASSLLIGQNNDGPTCPTGAPNCVSADVNTGMALDSLLTLTGLNVGGTYAVVLTQADNSAIGPNYGAGFTEAGQGNFTSSLYPCGQAGFCDAGLNARNGNWAVDITGVTSAAASGVPEPGTVFFLTSGLAGLGWLRRKRRAGQA
ncbi:MAG: PEP-CTERM sorting domain-containing protein [Acidobacteria bacterium]|nr:PEP-CTERM sorting domain-containing protein [Acidobacteriota bacterium]